MKTNVALIGFMAVGKSVVGKSLAEKTGKTFVEIDPLIEQKAGKSIPRIFKEDGEIAFRELEIAVIKEQTGGKNLIIACGGGVVLNKINIDRLKQEAVVVWLTASTQSIMERLAKAHETRPLISNQNQENDVEALYAFRLPFYERAAEIQVDTTGLSIAHVVKNIMDKLKKYADYR
jgi:shikimate kinase